MEENITADRFCKIIGLTGRGTSSKYVAKGLIVLDEFTRFVDVDKTIETLMRGREHHQALAQKAIDFFRGVINENNAHSIIRAVEHDTVINHIPHKSQNIISQNENNFYQENKPSLMEAMRDKNLIEIKLKQLQINEKVGKLVNKETVMRVFENILIQIKKDLLNLSRSTIDAILREKDNPQSAEKILYEAIHEVLRRNSGTQL